MKWLKHILVVIALTVAAMPCCHAESHDQHDHDSGTGVELCESHTCSCHSCDETPCGENLKMPQELTGATVSATVQNNAILLFVFTEAKPLLWQAPSAASDPLVSLKTVQLLI